MGLSLVSEKYKSPCYYIKNKYPNNSYGLITAQCVEK